MGWEKYHLDIQLATCGLVCQPVHKVWLWSVLAGGEICRGVKIGMVDDEGVIVSGVKCLVRLDWLHVIKGRVVVLQVL